jgi:V/A-type H+-transporting ATPase subunit G/H
MEMIKKIKEAESEAQKLIEQAKADAAEATMKARQAQQQAIEQAERDRKKATDDAIAAGRSQGLAEGDTLKAECRKQHQQLFDKAKSRMDAAVSKVIDYLRK